MNHIISIGVSTIGAIVGGLMILHILSIAGMSPFVLYIPLTMALAMGTAFVFNYKPPVKIESEERR
jgi:hypothetical protein